MPLARPHNLLLQRLRNATQVAHLELERALPLMHKDLSLHSYTELLLRFHSLYAPLERRFTSQASALATLGIDLSARRKSDWLLADLRTLRAGAPSPACERAAALPSVDNVWQAMGCLYVTEGATLGGQIIARHLRRRFNLEAQSGARFFASYGGQTGRMWRQYLAALTRCDISGAASQGDVAISQLVAAAAALFATFRAHLAPEAAP